MNEKNKMTGYPSKDRIWRNRSINAFIDLPNSDMNVYDYIYECNKDHLDDIAFEYDPVLEYPSVKITYRQFFKMVDDCAKSYLQMGIKQGEIVTVCLPSFVESIISFYALNRIGAISNHIHPLASKDEVKFYLEEAKSKIFVSYDGNYENFKDAVEELDVEHVIMVSPLGMVDTKTKLQMFIDDYRQKMKENNAKFNLKNFIQAFKKATKKEMPSIKYISYEDFISQGKKYKKNIETVYKSYQPASLTHTSGTTGKSKGVLSSSFGYNEMVRQIGQETPNLSRGDKELLVLPPYPIYVLCNNIHMCLARGISVIAVPKVDYKNIHRYFEKHNITAIQGIPSIINAMVKDKGFEENQIDLSNVKFIVSGGGSISANEIHEANDFLHQHGCKCNVTVGYGMSEMGSCSTCTFNENSEIGIVGRPLNDTNVMIVNPETEEELGYNQQGEIWLSGPCRMIEYYMNPEATKKIFKSVVNEDGTKTIWVRTGDIGLITDRGDLKYIGREKRITMIVDSDTNTVSKISNDYVEDLIIGKYASGEVSECIVVSVPSKEKMNQLKAYVLVKEAPYTKIVEEIDNKCQQVLRDSARPIEYIFVDGKMPETKAGKKDFVTIEKIENGQIENQGQVKIRKRVMTTDIRKK